MIPVAYPKGDYEALTSEIDAAIRRVFESGRYILGQEVEAFEQEFAAYIGAKYAVGVGSGTDAIALSLLALGVGPGDEVITTPLTAVYTSLAISMTGATPVFVDIDPDTYNLDPSLVSRKLTSKTKAIVPVHLYGHPVDMDPLLELARERALPVVEDASQAHGASYHGCKVGSLGTAGCFSLYPTKNLGACGDAGIVTTDSAELFGRLRLLRNGGQADRYHHVIRGRNSRLDELQAAMLRVKLRHLDAWNALRRQAAAIYRIELSGHPLQVPMEKDYAYHVYHLYVVRARERESLRDRLKESGVLSEIHYPRLVPFHEAYSPNGVSSGDLPVATQVVDQILSLPMFPSLSEKSIRSIGRAIRKFYSGSSSETIRASGS